MKVLVTGFEPFGGESVNPSYEAAKALPAQIEGAEILVRQLPVTFHGAGRRLLDLVEELEPDLVICVGQAGGRKAITPEKVAINYRRASIPDNLGVKPLDEPIAPGGETAYFSTLPVLEIVEAMEQEGIPAAVSYSAGTYVCNEIMYVLLSYIAHSQKKMLGGFIHVPYAPEQGKENAPSLPMKTMTKGLALAIQASIQAYRK